MADRMGNENATAQAAELAELILDEVSKADQDWQRIAAWAGELVEVARKAAGRSTGAENPPPAP